MAEPSFLAPRQQAGDVALVEWVDARAPRAVAIDAPLSLPHSLMCEVTGCPRCEVGYAHYLTRDVDRAAGGISTANLGPIAFRGIYLSRLLRRRGHQVIECYPAAAFRALSPKVAGLLEKQTLLATLVANAAWDGPGRVADQVDALAAAIVAAEWVAGRARRALGEDGELWLPGGLGDGHDTG